VCVVYYELSIILCYDLVVSIYQCNRLSGNLRSDLLLLPTQPTRRRLCDRSICHSVNRITDERGNGRRLELGRHGQGVTRGDPLEVINFWW